MPFMPSEVGTSPPTTHRERVRRRPSSALVLAVVSVFAVGVSLAACTGEDPDLTPTTADGGEDAPSRGPDGGEDAFDAGLTTCDAAAVDTRTNSAHCGACGHDCAGGECAGGRCRPVTIVSNLARPFGVTTGGTGVLWIRGDGDAGAVESCPTSGCGGNAPTVITADVSPPIEPAPTGVTIVSDGIHVHWISRGRSFGTGVNNLYGCNLTLCTPKEASGNTYSAVQLARDGKSLLYRLSGGAIRSCAFGSCPETPGTVIGAPEGSLGLAVAGDRLFYASKSSAPNPDNVFACTLDQERTSCGNVAPMISAPDISFLGVSKTTLYAISGNKLLACGVDGCANAPATLTTDLPPVVAFAIDDDNAYFAERGEPGTKTGSIRACSLPSCAGGLRTVLDDLASPTSLWLDDGILYFAESGDVPGSGSIRKIRP